MPALPIPDPPLGDGVVMLRQREERDLSAIERGLREPAHEARGKGLATRAVRLISRWALRELGLPRLGLFTEPWNVASQRVAERAGFQREGVLRSWTEIDGRRRDYVSFSLLPGDLAEDECGT